MRPSIAAHFLFASVLSLPYRCTCAIAANHDQYCTYPILSNARCLDAYPNPRWLSAISECKTLIFFIRSFARIKHALFPGFLGLGTRFEVGFHDILECWSQLSFCPYIHLATSMFFFRDFCEAYDICRFSIHVFVLFLQLFAHGCSSVRTLYSCVNNPASAFIYYCVAEYTCTAQMYTRYAFVFFVENVSAVDS